MKSFVTLHFAVSAQDRVVSGVGNWVADEVCFQACVHPGATCNTLSPEQVGWKNTYGVVCCFGGNVVCGSTLLCWFVSETPCRRNPCVTQNFQLATSSLDHDVVYLTEKEKISRGRVGKFVR